MENIQEITSHWELITTVLVLMAGTVKVVFGRCKKIQELEDEKTKNRKLARDKEISDLRFEFDEKFNEVKKEASGIGKSLDEHIEEDKKRNEKLQEKIEYLQKSFNEVDKNISIILAILKEREKKEG